MIAEHANSIPVIKKENKVSISFKIASQFQYNPKTVYREIILSEKSIIVSFFDTSIF